MKYILTCFLTLVFVGTGHSDEIDTGNSSFTWKATKVTGGHEGQIFPSAGAIEVKDGVVQSGSVTMDMKTFTVTDIQGKWKSFSCLKSDDFLMLKIPRAT